jgi:hypothetical protein
MPVVSAAFDLTHYRFYNDDGSESGATANAAQDTDISLNAYSDANIVLRIMVQETGSGGGSATDDWQLQYSKNAGAYTSITTGTTNVKGFNSSNLTDGGATTNRLTGGTGSFVAGLVSEDGLADNLAVTLSNYTEFLYTLTVVAADTAAADTLDFRVLNNGGLITYTVVPTITVTKVAPAPSTDTNLLIGHAEIPLAADSITFSSAADTGWPIVNLFGGSRFDMFRVATAASGDHLLTIDLGSGVTATADFLYFSKANLLQNDDVGTITLKAHSANNYAAATTITTISSFGSATLRGPHSEDYIATFTETAAYRYWFVNYNASAVSQVPHSKVFLGKLFDPGVDPTPDMVITRKRNSGSRRKALYTFKLKWEGLTYAKTKTMLDTYARTRRYNAIILVTQSYHELLHDHRVIIGRITSFTSPPTVTDYNSVSMTVEEMY